MVKLESDGTVKLLMTQEKEVFRRQDSPEIYDITTVAYVSSPDYILNNFGLFSGCTSAVEVPKERAVDIDDIYDFKLAEVILNERLGR
jgi:N-acylneuraminate cytidylyltransferase